MTQAGFTISMSQRGRLYMTRGRAPTLTYSWERGRYQGFVPVPNWGTSVP